MILASSSTRKSQMKGFTLIELLVVIAIIGILSSVVLASLNTARNKGADTAVKSNLASARAQAELFFDANGNSYMGTTLTATDVCNVAGLVGGVKGIYPSVLAAANAVGITTPTQNAIGSATVASCNSTATAWAAQVPLKTGGFFCVDNTGAANYSAASVLTATSDTAC